MKKFQWMFWIVLWVALLLGCAEEDPHKESTDVPNPQITPAGVTQPLEKSISSVQSSLRITDFIKRLNSLNARLTQVSDGPLPGEGTSFDDAFSDEPSLFTGDDDSEDYDEDWDEWENGSISHDYSKVGEDGGFIEAIVYSDEDDNMLKTTTKTYTVNTEGDEIFLVETRDSQGTLLFKEETIFYESGGSYVEYYELEEDGTINSGKQTSGEALEFTTTFTDGTVQTGSWDTDGNRVFDSTDDWDDDGDDDIGQIVLDQSGNGSSTFTLDDGSTVKETYNADGSSTSTETAPNGDTVTVTYRTDNSYTEVQTFVGGKLQQITIRGSIDKFAYPRTEKITEEILYRDGTQETIQTEITALSYGNSKGTQTFNDGTVETFESVALANGSIKVTGKSNNSSTSESSSFELVTNSAGVTEVTEEIVNKDGTSTIRMTLNEDGKGTGTVTQTDGVYQFTIEEDGSGTVTNPKGETSTFQA